MYFKFTLTRFNFNPLRVRESFRKESRLIVFNDS